MTIRARGNVESIQRGDACCFNGLRDSRSWGTILRFVSGSRRVAGRQSTHGGKIGILGVHRENYENEGVKDAVIRIPVDLFDA
ncbi:hypothetical protein PIB30_020368 [Stylosanthes scabra]|uniref:Uncharacterized protein n=1 Tax=Stylosanthes scabra TaxID=79078 RepID=A0ABU6Q8C4_9FABA|nr:hypothetical protein [Stylosanthes scabra]